jgi:mannose-6-phosphate isomerase
VSSSPPADRPLDERLALGNEAGTGEQRPWGAFVVLDDGPAAKVKRITVDPGKRLSYQLHHRRAEHWFVVAGTAHVTLDDIVHEVPPGQAIDIPLGTAHRVQNLGSEPLVFIEVQQGDYFGEDDIVRLSDDYGRAD